MKRRVENFARGAWLLVASAGAAWLGMMLVHELGHVLHAWISGAHVESVSIPLLGFSRTEVSHNSNPIFVAWGGLVWGIILPMVPWALARAVRTRAAAGARFFATICLIGNGAYMCSVLTDPIGDVADIRAGGGPAWPLALAGIAALLSGVLLLASAIPTYRSALLRPSMPALLSATGCLLAAAIAAALASR
jgi:hypothetical protein